MLIGIAIAISALLTAGLTYRSALVMQELNLARADVLRIPVPTSLRACSIDGPLTKRRSQSWRKRNWKARLPLHSCATSIALKRSMTFGHEFDDNVIIEIAGVFLDFAEQNAVLAAAWRRIRRSDGRHKR